MAGETFDIGGKPVKKTTVYIAAALGVAVVGYAVYSKRKSASAAAAAPASTLVTDPAGSQCAALDPNSGYCPGTPADVAYQQSGQTGLNSLGYGGSSTGGYAYPVTPGQGISTPGSVVPTFTDNASWAQYVEGYMVSTLGADPNTVGNALGKYITGQPVTADQQAIIEQAIAYANQPPVAGPGGFPPSIRLTASTPPPPATTVSVPNVVGQGFGRAWNLIHDAGLTPGNKQGSINSNYLVTKQSVAAGSKVAKGTTVTLTAPAPTAPKPKPPRSVTPPPEGED
jgi:hypothetical protein